MCRSVRIYMLSLLIFLASTQSIPTLYILSLLPYPDPIESIQPSWTEGPALILAEQLAIDLINNRTDILPDYRLELIKGDSGCNIITKAALSFVTNTLYNERNVAGIVGPGCSTSALTVSPLSGNAEIALINVHGAGSLLLEDRTTYPYSFGTLDSTKAFAQAAQRLLKENKWNRVGAIYDPARAYYSTTLQYFEDLFECPQFFKCSTNFIFAVKRTSIPLKVFRDSFIRIIYLFLGPDFLRKTLCLAFHQNMRPPTYQWIIISRVIEEITETSFRINNREYSCNIEEMRQMVTGSLILHYSLQPLNQTAPQDQGISYAQFLQYYDDEISAHNSVTNEVIEPSFWATAFFDATWALALALNNSQKELKRDAGIELSHYHYGHSNATDLIRRKLLELSFNGVSGRIVFSESTGYVPRLIDVYQVKMNKMDIVAYYNSVNDSITITNKSFRFINGTFNQEVTIISVHSAIGVVYALLTIIQTAIIIILHIFTIVFRKHKPIKASSPKLSHIAFIGCYILVVSAISHITGETFIGHTTSESIIRCNLIYVTYIASSTGGTLVFGTVCAHIWRLYRIFVFYQSPGRLINDKLLIAFVLILFSCNLLLCSVWVGIDRLVPTKFQTESVEGNRDVQVFVEIRCSQISSIYWLISLLAFNLLVMGIALCLAILTRHIPYKDFKTRRIVLLVYILSAVLVVGYVTFYILQIRATAVVAQFIILSTVHSLVILFTSIFLLMPPVYSTLQDLKKVS